MKKKKSPLSLILRQSEISPPEISPLRRYSRDLMEGAKFSRCERCIFLKLLGEGEAVRIAGHGGNLADRQGVVQQKLLCCVEAFLDQVGMGRYVEFLAEQLAEVFISQTQVFRHAPAAVVRDLTASQQISCLFEKRTGSRDHGLFSVHIVDQKDKLLCFQKEIRQLFGRGKGQVFIKLKTFVKERLGETGEKDGRSGQESQMPERTVGFITETDKKLQPFPILLCDGGMSDIGKTLNEASGIDPGAFSVFVNIGSLAAQEKEGAVVFKYKVFVL